VIQALAYLWVQSAKNRVWTRLKRLRQPKYLVGGIVGILYLWTFLFRNMLGGGFGPRGDAAMLETSPEMVAALEVAGAWGLLLMLAGFWILPSRRAALDFSEAEIQFLFPAPVSRTGLLHFKLASWQAGLLFTSLMVSLFSGRLLRADGAWMSVLGWWMGLLLLQLHSLGASFVRTWLLDRGVAHWQRRLAVAAVLGGAFTGALAWGWREAPPWPGDLGDVEGMLSWWVEVSRTTPIEQILMPLRWVARMAMTRNSLEFLGLLGPVVLMLVVHYLWVIRATVAFEEASVDAARAALSSASRSEAGSATKLPGGRTRAPLIWRLAPTGPVWMGLTWKNLAASGDWYRGRTGLAVVCGLVLGAVAGAVALSGTALAATVGTVALMLWVFSVVVGPSGARTDLRRVLGGSSWEVLKSLPLSGWQVVLGELMAPWWVLTAVQCGLGFLAVGYLPAPVDWGEVGMWQRGWVFFGMSMLGPAVSLVGLCLQNGAALLFPAWVLVAPGQARGGFEVLGQRMIVYVGQMLGLLVALVPAAAVGVVVHLVVAWGLGHWIGFGVAASVVAGVLLAESAAAIGCLGWLWDRTDLSKERTA
jgi:hypothetical protein